ncbi:thioredoxin domain-containing protein [Streptomyces sp. NPDC060194]|uniref:thioredoxin domain-containing protein n=1 Tax=Streptomyces sp. NPDC060194 TaxID=3347069 RepID=UPI00364F6326
MIPAHTTGPDATVLPYGRPDAPHVLAVFADLRCPSCKRMENGLGTVMERAADAGTVRLEYHFGTFLDAAVGGTGSLRALAALGAAADAGPACFIRYLHQLYASQPPESDDAFAAPEHLLHLAADVADLRSAAFDAAVRDGSYVPWARTVSAAFDASGVTSTPTVLLDGRPLAVLSPEGYPVTPETFLAELEA